MDFSRQVPTPQESNAQQYDEEPLFPQTGKNHEFRKYHCQLAVEHYVSKGWDREKAEKYVIQRHLSHSSERQDLKKIYLYS